MKTREERTANRKLRTKFYNMKRRCLDQDSHHYYCYGARGITIYQEWLDDIGIFVKWALDNGYEDGLQIDRIDNDGNYEPSNCRFVCGKDNLRNTSRNKFLTYNGETKCVSHWAEDLGIHVETLRSRLTKLGWSLADALAMPAKPDGKHKITHNGKTLWLHDWATLLQINYNTLYNRIFVYKWDIPRAMDTPLGQRR